jgi:hypothetical protein
MDSHSELNGVVAFRFSASTGEGLDARTRTIRRGEELFSSVRDFSNCCVEGASPSTLSSS